jgi:hypothetical protein
MAVEALKSASITNDDATPIVLNTAGQGAPAGLQVIDDYKAPSASASVGSTYRIVRVPTTAKIKVITLESEAQGAGKVDVGVYAPNGGAVVDADFFASAVDLAAAVTPTDITNESGTYTVDKRSQPLWQAVGASTDPGGFYDIVLTVVTTAVTTGTGKTYLRVSFAN